MRNDQRADKVAPRRVSVNQTCGKCAVDVDYQPGVVASWPTVADDPPSPERLRDSPTLFSDHAKFRVVGDKAMPPDVLYVQTAHIQTAPRYQFQFLQEDFEHLGQAADAAADQMRCLNDSLGDRLRRPPLAAWRSLLDLGRTTLVLTLSNGRLLIERAKPAPPVAPYVTTKVKALFYPRYDAWVVGWALVDDFGNELRVGELRHLEIQAWRTVEIVVPIV